MRKNENSTSEMLVYIIRSVSTSTGLTWKQPETIDTKVHQCVVREKIEKSAQKCVHEFSNDTVGKCTKIWTENGWKLSRNTNHSPCVGPNSELFHRASRYDRLETGPNFESAECKVFYDVSYERRQRLYEVRCLPKNVIDFKLGRASIFQKILRNWKL